MKKFIETVKKCTPYALALVFGLAVLPANAAGTADTTILTGFTGIIDNVIATMSAVGVIALGIFAIKLAWRYAKDMFKVGARG